MITVQNLQDMLSQAVDERGLRQNSEVRYIDRDGNDCSFEDNWCSIGPGFGKNGMPVDRRFGTGAFFLAQECKLRDAPEQLLLALDW